MNSAEDWKLNARLRQLSPEQRAKLALKLSKPERRRGPEKTAAFPKAQAQPGKRFEQFPLSDIQQAYLIGREEGVELGNIACRGLGPDAL
jgi:hypothetical protein